MNTKTPVGSVQEAPRVEPSALVICCSAHDAVPDVITFVRTAKGIASYDLLALPGGAFAASRSNNKRDARDYVLQEIQFLVHAHHLPLVMIFGHADPPCAKYKATRGSYVVSDTTQVMADDIRNASRSIRTMCGDKIRIEAYISYRDGKNNVDFYMVD